MAAEQHVENEENSEESSKRKRETSVLDNFTKLTNAQESVRIKSGVNLIKHLTEVKYGEKTNDELKYALGRLIRGLGSSNIYAKTGFFATLVGLLNLKNVTVDEVFEHVSKELHKGGSNSKSENVDIASGRILVAGAILRSNLFESCKDAEKTKVIELLLSGGKERTYLSLASYKFLSDLFTKIDTKQFEALVFPIIKNDLAKPWNEQNLDTFYLLLEIENNFPQSLHKKFLKNNLGTEEVLSVESLQHICTILTTIPKVAALKHPVFEIFIKKLIPIDLTPQFFEKLDLTLNRPNRSKYFVFTKLLTILLESEVEPTLIPEVLTKNFIQNTISMYKTSVGKQKDKEFQDITQKLFEVLVSCLKKDGVKSKIKIKILKKLLFFPGTFIFEKVTRSKLIQNITLSLNSEGVKKLGSIYKNVILNIEDKVVNENTTEKWWNVDRIYASHLLVKLLNHPSMHDDNEWKIEQLLMLAKLGLLKDESGNISNDLADSFKEAFYSALDLKLSKLDDLRLILSKLVSEFDSLIENLRYPINENHEIWTQTVQLATKLSGKTKRKNAVFHILFLHLGLQIFNNVKLATSSLTELFVCYDKTKKGKEIENGDDPLWIEVVVDLFLNLLSHNSHLLRSLINCVFPHLCKYITEGAIQQILGVLDPENETNPLSQIDESSDDDDDDDNKDEDSEESQSSNEEVDETVNDKLRLALHQALAESDAESIDLDDLDQEQGDKLNTALAQAFKQFKPNLGRNKKQKKDDELLTHFRIRVLDLIEIYLNSNPSMLITLEIMLPLLRLLEFCIKDDHQKPLQHRVLSTLKKLCSLKKFSDFDGVTSDNLEELLKSMLDKGSKNIIIVQEMSQKIADCCIFVINCDGMLESDGKIKKIIEESLEAFFTRRDCIIPYIFFKSLLSTNWDGISTLVPFLSGFVFSKTVRPFRRNQAIDLLKVFFHNQRYISANLTKLEVEDIIVNFLKDCVDFFREFNTNPAEVKVKEKFLCNLFDLLNLIKNSMLGKKFNEWGVLGDVVRECRSFVTFARDTKLVYNKLCKSLNINSVVKMKDNTIKLSNLDEDDGDNKKKKKKIDKEVLKLKKQTKELRLQSLSEGLGKRRLDLDEDDDRKRMKSNSDD